MKSTQYIQLLTRAKGFKSVTSMSNKINKNMTLLDHGPQIDFEVHV